MKSQALKLGSRTLIPQCLVADNFIRRFTGLMLKASISSEEALVFPHCNSIHTCFMKFPIDVLFIGKDGVVIEILESMRSWRFVLPRFKARHVIEMKANRSKQLGIFVGAKLSCNGVFSDV